MKRQLVTIFSLMLGGCTSTHSFSTPPVSVSQGQTVTQTGFRCAVTDNTTAIGHDVAGAIGLIDNFVNAYRCAVRELANGRRDFEIPALLTLIGGAAAAALGTGRDVAVATGVTAGVFNAGKSYFDPQAKLRTMQAAVDALICIKTEAVGIEAYVTTVEAAERGLAGAGNAAGLAGFAEPREPTVSVPFEEQYFQLVSAALLQVENIAAQRLSAAGAAYTPDAILAELKDLARKQDEPPDEEASRMRGEAEVARAGIVAPPVSTSGNAAMPADARSRFADAVARLEASAAMADLKLKDVRPKLQECIVRAKT